MQETGPEVPGVAHLTRESAPAHGKMNGSCACLWVTMA